MLPPTFSWEVRRMRTPRSSNRRASVRCTIVAPTCDLLSSPTIGGPAGSLHDLLFEVLAEAVVGHAAVHGHAEIAGHFGELHRVVLTGPDRLSEVLADLRLVDVEGGRELDVAHVVAAEVDVHQAGDVLRGVGLRVVLDALHERRCAVADADDRDADLVRLVARDAVLGGGAVTVDAAVAVLGHGKRLLRRDSKVTPKARAAHARCAGRR